MTVIETPARVDPRPSSTRSRDTGIDLLRAVSVIAVVVLHALMVGVTVTPSGPVFENAADSGWWIVPVSWVLQVMPLFFIIGGFAGAIALRRQREAGGTASAFVADRLHRLLRPAGFTIAAVGAGLALLSMAGVPAGIVAVAGFRFGQPLWFLGVFLLCQALLPALLRLHEQAPLRTLGLLVGAAVSVDAIRLLSGLDAIGFLNLAFVWLTLQQIGFLLADGRIDRVGVRTRIGIAAACAGLLLVSFLTGVHSPDLIANLNPPTNALLLVGGIQIMLVSLLRERIAAWSRRPRVRMLSDFVNRRTMTIYLWHMPVLLGMAGLCVVLGLVGVVDLPHPGEPLWWTSRPLWVAGALAVTAVVAVPLSRVEAAPAPADIGSPRRIALGTMLGISAVVMLLVAGTSVLTAASAVLAMFVARRLAQASALRSEPSALRAQAK
ncbi:acyltransferase [Microbacterium sp. ZW T5_45]|uniref:acyltransferase family protein n=1 Tax=Microbacterium sp. ZW T5_45 TaxID=3378080 RepID=UPI003854B816